MAWICIAVSSSNLETVLFELLSAFHGDNPPRFEVYACWAHRRLSNQLYLSPAAYNSLVDLDPERYEILGPVSALPAGVEPLMGLQPGGRSPVVPLHARFLDYEQLMAGYRFVPRSDGG